jgi:hypothetical protein
LKNVPWKITDQDICDFFTGYNMVPGSLRWQLNGENKKTGLVAVLFETVADADRALREKHK